MWSDFHSDAIIFITETKVVNKPFQWFPLELYERNGDPQGRNPFCCNSRFVPRTP